MNTTVTVIGNLTRDPELKSTQTGKPLANLGMASSRRYQVNGEWTEQTSFFNITAWGDMAEHIKQSLSKGDRVVVTGRLEQRSWETDAGEKRSVVEIIADEVSPSLRWATVAVTRTPKGEATPGSGSAPSAWTPAAMADAFNAEEVTY